MMVVALGEVRLFRVRDPWGALLAESSARLLDASESRSLVRIEDADVTADLPYARAATCELCDASGYVVHRGTAGERSDAYRITPNRLALGSVVRFSQPVVITR